MGVTVNSTYTVVNKQNWAGQDRGLNALTLLHELGHIFNILPGAGGSHIKYDTILLGTGPNRDNDARILMDCF